LSFGLVPNAKHYTTINLSGLQTAKDLIDRLQRITKSGPRKDKRGVDLISDALPFGGLWYDGPDAVSNVPFFPFPAPQLSNPGGFNL
jgi:hypothetical protein